MAEKEAQTANQRKKLERDLKRESGLVPIEIWIHPVQKVGLKKIEKKCQEDKKYLRD
jgi:hypothetical protein